jgi:hypothetical protein
MTQVSESSLANAGQAIAEIDALDRVTAGGDVESIVSGPADDGPLSHGELVWTIKQTFVNYVTSMADGLHIVRGAAHDDAHGFRFAPTPTATAARRAEEAAGLVRESRTEILCFTGEVEFTGHRGMLRVVIGDPQLTHDGKTGFLSITDPDWEGRRMVLALFDVTRPEAPAPAGAEDTRALEAWRGTNVRLTADGADLFVRAYETGDPLDDFTVHHP